MLEFYAVPPGLCDAGCDAAQGKAAVLAAISEAGALVGSVSVNSGVADQLFE